MTIISNWPWTGRLMKPREGFHPIRWGFGFDAPAGLIRRLAIALGPDAIGRKVRLRLWHRPDDTVASAFDAAIFSAPPLHDRTQTINGSEYDAIPRFHWFDLPPLDGGGLFVCEVTMPLDGSEEPFGIGVATFEAPWDWEAGWFMVRGRRPRPAKLPAGIAWMLGEVDPTPAKSSFAQPLDARPCESDTATFSLAVPELDIERSGWRVRVPPHHISIPQPASRMATAIFEPDATEVRLPFRHAELLEPPPGVQLRTNPTRLVRGTGILDAEQVEYRGWECRYDAISIDRNSGRLHLTQGPGRALDPEEHPAESPEAHRTLFSVYTTYQGGEAIRVDDWSDMVRHGEEERHIAWLEYCRRRLPRTLKSLRAGRALRLIGYGDSVTSLGGRHPDQILSANGRHRDRFGYFEQYGDDWREKQLRALPEAVEDGVPHHRFGWNWHLKRSIEERWPVEVEYLNWGLPGTTTGSDEALVDDGLLLPNGNNPQRLERLIADAPDLVVVAFGTNDVGTQIDTRANLVKIIRTIRAANAEVIIVAPCPPNPGWGSRDPMLWLQTYDDTIAAARDADVAFVPTLEIFGAGREGATGLSQQSYSAASMGNHPGPRELAVVGKLLSSIIP